MAGRYDELFRQDFTATDTIIVTHNLNRFAVAVRVLIDAESRADLISDIALTPGNARNELTVTLTSAQTGTIQLTSTDVPLQNNLSPELVSNVEQSGGQGDVVGPGASTDDAVVRFDGTTGKLVQGSGVTVDDSGNVSVPGTVDGRDVATDGTKLDGVEAGADVTDAANVAAAGAVMDGDFSGTYPAILTRTGPATYAGIKTNETAGSPTVGDDSTQDYAVGSRWINTTTGDEFVCVDASVGAASWILTTTASGDTSNYFEAYDNAGGTTIPGVLTDIPLDTQRIVGSDYSHTAGQPTITINTTATYLVYGHVSTEIPATGGTSRSESAGILVLDAGSGFGLVGGTVVWLYNRTQGAGSNTGSFLAILNLSAGDILKLQAIQLAGTSVIETAAGGSGLSIVRIGIGAGIDAEQIQGRAVSSTQPTNNQVLVWNDAASEWQPADQSGGGGDELVKVSANDTTAGYLNGKLVAGTNITLTEQNDGGNETLQVSATAAPPDCQEVVSSSTITTTATSPVAMTGMTLTAPATGSYLAIFSVYTENSLAGWSVRMRIHVNGTFQASTERHTQVNAAGYTQVLATTRRLSLTAGDSVQVYWYTGGSGTASAFDRCLQLVRVTAV